MSWKLCFPSAARGKIARDESTSTKRSFADKGVPKLELGNEVGVTYCFGMIPLLSSFSTFGRMTAWQYGFLFPLIR